MAVETNAQNISGNSPDIYEGSCKEIFTHINFNFSLFYKAKSKREVGRPKFPDGALRS